MSRRTPRPPRLTTIEQALTPIVNLGRRVDRRLASEIRASYPELAEAVGMSKDTVGKCLDALSNRADAPLIKDTRTEWREIPDPETGEKISRPTSVTYVRARGEGSILSAVAAYRPDDRPKHGGKRLPRCPEHPTADLVIRATTHCADCDRQLGPPRETLRPQLAGVGESSLPDVYVSSLNRPLVAVVQNGASLNTDKFRARGRGRSLRRRAAAAEWSQPAAGDRGRHQRGVRRERTPSRGGWVMFRGRCPARRRPPAR